MMRLGFTLQQGYLIILASLVFLIGAGTIYGLWTEGKAQSEEALHRLAIANARVRLGWWLIIIFAVAWWLGTGCLIILFAGFSFFLLREFIALTPIKHTDHWVLVIAFYLAIPIQYLLVYFELMPYFTVFIPVYLFLLLPVVASLSHDNDRYLERVAKVQWGVMVCVYCVSHAPAIATLDVSRFGSSGAMLLLFFLIVSFCSDLFSVLASSMLGGHASRMIPNKTIKGVAIGFLAAMAVGLALFWLTPFRLWQTALFTAAIIISGIMGDIVVNSIKKSLGNKGWESEMYIGRGVLERFAPLIFSAPVFYHLALVYFSVAI